MPRFAHFAAATPAGSFAPLSAQPLANPSPCSCCPPHGSPRSSTVCSSLYPPAAVVILCRFPRRNSRIRQQYPRCHLLCRLQPHTDYFGFQRGMPPFAPFDIGFPRQCSFRLCHFQCHMFALVMHVFVETVAGFPARILVPCTLYRRVPRRCTCASAPGMDAPPHPTRAGGKRYRLRGQYYG